MTIHKIHVTAVVYLYSICRNYFQPPLLQYILLKDIENVKSIIEADNSEAFQLDSERRSPLHAAAFGGTSEIIGMHTYTTLCI